MKKNRIALSTPPPIPEQAKKNVERLLATGRLFRYGEDTYEDNHTALLEHEFSKYLGSKYCVAMNSCGSTLFVALKSIGINSGDKVLFNAFTLAPVPGAIYHANATPIPVDIKTDLTISIKDLIAKVKKYKPKVLLLSHMRGHVSNMKKVVQVCEDNNLLLIEDCAHTMGAFYNNQAVGTFGKIACFSTQSFKHINSGEGGLLVTNDDDICAKSILYSGSYALYHQHLSKPPQKVFDKYQGKVPNCSLRMSNLIAAIIRPQIAQLQERKQKWNRLYHFFEKSLSQLKPVEIIPRNKKEDFVGSSIQFYIQDLEYQQYKTFVKFLNLNDIHIKWFGKKTPSGFTEQYTHWHYMENYRLNKLDSNLKGLFDLRLPLFLKISDCKKIVKIIKKSIFLAEKKSPD